MEGEWELATGISARLTSVEGRKFGLLVGGAFLILGLLSWRRAHLTSAYLTLGLATALIAGGVIVPTKLGPIYHGWMALARAMSKVTTPIFMAVLFFLVFTPTGFLSRLFGHRPLTRRKGATYWQARPVGGRQGSMDHQY